MQHGSAADLRRRFSAGRPSIDLVHTGGEKALTRFELVHDPDDLARLLGLILGIPTLTADAGDLHRARALRAAVTRLAYGRAGGPRPPVPVDPPRPGDADVVNAAAAIPPLVPALRGGGARVFVEPTTTAALSTLARDAIDLFAGPLSARIRVCAADGCGLLLVDTSRGGQRRWCSMATCGNRTKVRAFRSAG